MKYTKTITVDNFGPTTYSPPECKLVKGIILTPTPSVIVPAGNTQHVDTYSTDGGDTWKTAQYFLGNGGNTLSAQKGGSEQIAFSNDRTGRYYEEFYIPTYTYTSNEQGVPQDITYTLTYEIHT